MMANLSLQWRWMGATALLLLAMTARADEDCAAIESDKDRLACYDAIYRSAQPKVLVSTELVPAAQSDSVLTPLEQRFQAEAEVVANPFAITPHKPNYILPFTHNTTSDFGGYGALGQAFNEEEIKLQVSLKTPLLKSLWGGSSLWFAYTQQAYWQLYAEDLASAPFRETNYQPELFWQIPTDREWLGWRARLLRFGINHQSNGETQRFSRSWNRLTAEAVVERGNLVGSVKAWHRLEEDPEDDDNPDIENYMGRTELGLAYRLGSQSVSVSLINNLRLKNNRSGVELNWMFPLLDNLKGYVQIYSGYGENMFDAENYSNRVGIGFALNDWL